MTNVGGLIVRLQLAGQRLSVSDPSLSVRSPKQPSLDGCQHVSPKRPSTPQDAVT